MTGGAQLIHSVVIRVLEAVEAMPSARLALKTFCESGRFDLAARSTTEPQADTPVDSPDNRQSPTKPRGLNGEIPLDVSGAASAFGEPSVPEAAPAQKSMSFKLTKINERGRHQERILQLSNDGPMLLVPAVVEAWSRCALIPW